MSDNSANSKRIAKNTLMLYFRMLLMMGVTLYTSRVVLSALGVEDYGIYNVVGGVVAMFVMISNALSGAISRFLTIELGSGNQKRLNIVFSTSIIIQFVIGVIVIILVESVGTWFLVNKMVIPPDRLFAAKWVLQFSLLTLVINLISIPYNAVIIAHERMSAFAYIGIVEAANKLIIAYLINYSPLDNMIFYAIMLTISALVIRLIYGIYCRRHFEECKFRFEFDKALFKEMFNFSVWNFIGRASGILRDQGGNILLNILGGGPAINAARGISTQVNTAIQQFSTNFMMALNPQITKSYACGDYKYMMTLMSQGARLSYYMLLILSLPIIISTPYILEIWLKIVPEYTVVFVRLVLVLGICESLSNPLITAVLATGDIKTYQIVVGGMQLVNLPVSYIFLKIGYSPTIVLVVAIFISICCLGTRLYMLRGLINLSVREYISKVVVNVCIVSAFAVVIPYLFRMHIPNNFTGFILVSLICILWTAAAIYILGCNRDEKTLIYQYLQKSIKKITKD